MSLLKTLPRINELQTPLYTKRKEFTEGLRNKTPHEERKALKEDSMKLHQEIVALRSKRQPRFIRMTYLIAINSFISDEM